MIDNFTLSASSGLIDRHTGAMEHAELTEVIRRPADQPETAQANRSWWDVEAPTYQREHGTFLGERTFRWGPEGLDESAAGLLGHVTGARVLDVGAGAGQTSRWLVDQGAQVVAIDLSIGMLSYGGHQTQANMARIQADALKLPLASTSIDIACSAYGAVPFVADSHQLQREVARVLRPGGRWVFALTHPFRWALPDDPGTGGLVVTSSYFDRTPYVEEGPGGVARYVEHHRTIGDRVRELSAAGFELVDLVEPPWPDGHEQTWGGWSPLRGRLIPGTAIFCCRKTAR